MIVAEVLAKSSPRKIIHIIDENEKSYFVGMVKDCPVEFYNLEVYDYAQWFVRIRQSNKS
jgi:hypothetical protein